MDGNKNPFQGEKLSEETRQEMKQCFDIVFKSNNPFEEPFQDQLQERILLYTQGFYLTKRQFEALMNTLKTLGETTFYISNVTSDDFSRIFVPDIYSNDHFKLSCDISYEDYRNHLIFLDNALYSSSGKWGVIISHEDHSIIGGTGEFMALFKKFYPYSDYDLKKFIEMWKLNQRTYKVELLWMPRLLAYVNSFTKSRTKIAPEKWKQMSQLLQTIFKDKTVYDEIFQNSMQQKLILFPTNKFHLNKTQFKVLMNVLKKTDETTFFMSQVNGWTIKALLELDAENDDHFELSCDITYEEYLKKVLIYETVLYSIKGTWGLLIAEECAVLGGSHEFIELFKKYYPQWEEDEKAFVKMWEEKNKHDGTDISWVPKLLEYVNASKEKKVK